MSVTPDQNRVTGELPDGRLLVTNRTGTYRVEPDAPMPCVLNAAGGPCRPVQCIDGVKCEQCGRPVATDQPLPDLSGRWRDEGGYLDAVREQIRMRHEYEQNCCQKCGAPDARNEEHDCHDYTAMLREQIEMWKHLVAMYDAAITGLHSGYQLGGTALTTAQEFADGLRPGINQRGETIWATPQ